jgi:phospholipid/cholesterol/gamma-HCH transport system substrate-binding protein
MITRSTRIRLLAFVVMAVIGVTYGAVAYVNLPRLLGIGRYDLTVQLPDGAGLYPNGVVSLRGVPIGQVEGVRLAATGAVADIQVENEVQLPRGAVVEVRSTSAVGEQYVNFAPQAPEGPYLADGDTIPVSQVQIPVSTANLLERANGLVASVPTDSLNTTVDELYNAFNGTGDDLGRLLDSAFSLQAAATENLGPTLALVEDLVPVLETQRETADDVRSYARDLSSFTEQLRMSDAQIRGTLDNVPGFLTELEALEDDLRPTLPLLLANLTSAGEVVEVFLPNIEQTVTILSATVNGVAGAIQSSPVPGTTRIDFRVVVNSPPACTEGFQEQRRSPSDLSPALPGTENFCDVAPDSPQAVRGSRNAPCPELSPRPEGRSNTARGCGLDFQTPEEAAAATDAAIRTQLEVAARNPKTAAEEGDQPPGTPNYQPDGPGGEVLAYDPVTGGFLLPDTGMPVIYGEAVTGEPTGWQDFLLNPLGVNR